jgi:signal peptidase I
MRKVVDWAVTIALAFGFVLVFEAEVAKPFRIPSASMERTLHCARPADHCLASFDDRILVNRLAYRLGSPQRGQIVVFRSPKDACGVGGTFVKRLIGMPGDTVAERDGIVYVNGARLHEPYVDPALRGDDSGTWHVPAGHYFMLGDDRANSCDSRTWGSVARSSLIGPALVIYWPPTRWHWF